ncbi:MAG TPA: Glu-tRNA(Gln) amidotransferase subunit GatE [Polyangia bacterium]|jgi:glutamyl-tRNA(Gln) amidotransferase subunit E
MIDSLDYEAIGLISGLEVHQQLLTREKLFCRCPAGLYTTSHDGEVLRHMRPTLSELGEYDGTALMEFKKKKEIVYLLNRTNVCTYEMDDTPPFLVNQDAIDISIELCLMMHMDVIDEVHIARKQYLDGSIPTGFQRTAIIGVNGWLPFRGRRLTVTHLSVEEDSSREVLDKGHRIVFRTDRLGMPLSETVTGADLRTPDEVRDAILLCGRVARSTRHVRVGIGAARQDVNVSVRGGSRVEIKGVSRAAYAPKLVHNEAVRQVNLLALRAIMHERGLAAPADVRMQSADVTDLFADTELDFIRRAVTGGGKVYAVRIEGVADLAGHPTQPNTVFLDELTGRIRVIACLDEPPILIGGSSMPEFLHVHRTRERIRKRLKIADRDDFFLVWGPEADCRTAANEIRQRFADATAGVPNETRRALPGGYTTFERILPGPDRMYPDTDSPPTRVTKERVDALRANLRPPPWVREQRYLSWGVPLETTHSLIRRGLADAVDEVVTRTGVDGRTAAIEIGQHGKALQRAGVPMERLGPSDWIQVFDLYTDGRLPREAIPFVAGAMAKRQLRSAAAAATACGIDLMAAEAWQEAIGHLGFADYRGGKDDSAARRLRYLAGEAVRLLKGRAPAKDVVAYVRHQLEGAGTEEVTA